MATELGFFSLLTQLSKPEEEHHLQHQQQQHKRQKVQSMWSYGGSLRPPPGSGTDAEDDSWEVRAFAEDTGGAMGTTWPPRFYACTFCRREFRSAQALGGHMNVHRRDRARLQQRPPGPITPPSAPPTVFPPAAPIESSSGLCFVYPVPATGPTAFPAGIDSSSAFFTVDFGESASSHEDSSLLQKVGSSRTSSYHSKEDDESVDEELDLELKLWW